MLRLTHLKLAGFKSFANPTTLEFSHNITAIVGPNGCGKSNVIDAIRWVLGESSAKQLRGASMRDVIFAGSQAKPAKSIASVELRFRQEDTTQKTATLAQAQSASTQQARQPKSDANTSVSQQLLKYSEIAIKRQVSKDGRSDYFINGNKVRRRDVVDVFLGTGLGARSYAVIEQGMISRIVEAQPIQLRAFIEEAAGVSRYQVRRDETQHQLDKTRDNLERLIDTKIELDTQLKRLTKQASTATTQQQLLQQQAQYNNELLLADMAEQQHALQQLQSQSNHRGEQLADIDQRRTLLQKKMTEGESHTNALKQRLNTITDAIQNKQNHILEQDQQLASLTAAQKYEQQRQHDLDSQIDKQKKALNQVAKRHKRTQEQIEDIQQQQRTLLDDEYADSQDAEAALAVIKTQLDEIKSQLRGDEIALTKLNQDKAVAQHANKQATQRQQQLHKQAKHLEKQLSIIDQHPSDAEHQTLSQQLTQTQDTIDQLEVHHQALLEQQQAHQQKQDTINQQMVQAKQAINVKQAEFDTLSRVQQQQKMRLGQRIDSSDARLLLNQIQLTEAGKPHAGLIDTVLTYWLTAGVQPEDNLEQLQSDANIAHWLLRTEEDNAESGQITINNEAVVSLQAWVKHPQLTWLQHTYVVPAIELGMLNDIDLYPHIRLLSEDGILLGQGWVQNLNQQASGFEPLSQQIVLDELKQHIDTLSQQRNDIQVQQQHIQQQLNPLSQQLQQVTTQLTHAQSEQTRLTQRRDQLVHQQQLKHQQRQLLIEQQSQLTQELQETEQTTDLSAQQLQDINDRLIAIEPSIKQSRLQQASLFTQQQSITQRLRDREYQQKRLNDQQRNLSEQLKQLTQRDIQISQDIAQLVAAQQTSTTKQAEQTASIATVNSKRTTYIRERDDLSEQRHTLQQSLNQHLAEQRQNQQTLTELSQQHEQLKAQQYQADTQIALLQQRWDDLQLKGQDCALDQAAMINAERLTDEQRQHIQEQLTKIATKIDNIGGVNLAAQQELEALQPRYQTLVTQIEDIETSIQGLTKAIRQIDGQTRQLFMDMLTQVNQHMQELFAQVFSGGQASLTLEDEKDWQSGLLLMAKPAGKKNSRLAMLSGGEKTLTALTLIFAIFQQNPAPFCVLDEVDAPLDDTNISRFVELINRLAANVQFVFISHNKLSMQAADELIGITMPEAGISTNVTVDIAKITEELASVS